MQYLYTEFNNKENPWTNHFDCPRIAYLWNYAEAPLCNVYLFFLDNPVADGSLGAVIVDSHFYQSLAFG